LSWVCDTCSCNNDDESLECFVCGSHRSEASIREARARQREKKFNEFSDFLYTKVFLGIKISTIVVGVVLIIGCIIKIFQGSILIDLEGNTYQIKDVVLRRLELFANGWGDSNIFELIGFKFECLAYNLSLLDLPESFGNNVEYIFNQLSINLSLLFSNFICALPPSSKFEVFSAIRDSITARSTFFKSFGEIFASHATDQTKFEVFSAVKSNAIDQGLSLKLFLDSCVFLTTEKIELIKEYVLIIWGNMQQSVEQCRKNTESMFDRGTSSVDATNNYIERVISKFKK